MRRLWEIFYERTYNNTFKKKKLFSKITCEYRKIIYKYHLKKTS
jgi:hypothetical protein